MEKKNKYPTFVANAEDKKPEQRNWGQQNTKSFFFPFNPSIYKTQYI